MYEASPDKVNIWPVGGGYWWHSREDTLDKVDFANALGQFTRNYTQTTKRGLLTTNKG